jgi:hypothetical protein
MTDERSFRSNTKTFEEAAANCSYAPLVAWFLGRFDEPQQTPPTPLRRAVVTAATAAPIVLFGGLVALLS